MSEKLQVHPVADLFPMLAPDELKELAADIAERGLLQPIVLDAEGRILDGRNRLAACELADVEPEYTTYDGDDPDGYALAVNAQRRDMTSGKRAMVAARAHRSKLERYGSQAALARVLRVPKSRVTEAVAVMDFTPELVNSVASGMTPLNKAYEVAKERKEEKAGLDAEASELAAEAPDLAAEVTEERMSLDEAKAILAERRVDAERQKCVAEIDAIRDADGAPPPSFSQRAEDGAITWTEAVALAERWLDERADAIKRATDGVAQVIQHWGYLRAVRDTAGTPYGYAILAALGDKRRESLAKILEDLKG